MTNVIGPPYILWGDVTIEEELEVMVNGVDGITDSLSTWTATYEGRPQLDGSNNPYYEPLVKFERSGATAMEAAGKLEHAARIQGWEIR